MYWLVVFPPPPFARGRTQNETRKISARHPLREFARSHKYNIYIYIYDIYTLYRNFSRLPLTCLLLIFHVSLQDPLIKHGLSERVTPSARLSHPRWERENVTVEGKARQPNRWSCAPQMQIKGRQLQNAQEHTSRLLRARLARDNIIKVPFAHDKLLHDSINYIWKIQYNLNDKIWTTITTL